jgi:hypothetical protein
MVSAAHALHDHANHEAIRASNALAPDYLFWRYLTTTPRAPYSLLNRGRSTDISGTHNQYISRTHNP